MKKLTGGTYFTGGNGVGIAFTQCGIRDVFGVEYDDKIAQVARDNGFHVITADVRDIDPAQLPRVDWFHASTVCKNASNAKADGEESPDDMETAQAVERYIDYHKPRFFSLENVWGYRTFKAFQDILKCLTRNGYQTAYWHLNSADYGVPQTRKRLILVARNDGKPVRKPIPTHHKNPSVMLGESGWIGWYEVIEDLLPTLPPSKFAQWQLDRLPKELTDVLMGGGNRSKSFLEFAKEHRPDTPGKRFKEEPSHTISATSNSDMRTFIMGGGDMWTPPVEGDAPIFTIGASKAEHPTRAFILGNNASDDKRGGTYGVPVRFGDEPDLTVHAQTMFPQKEFLMQVQGEGGDGIKEQAEPMQAVTANHGAAKYRAYLAQGRVVKMTPRALARFQTIPDTYVLPDNTRLACTIIGNAVPPRMLRRVIEANLQTGAA